MALQLVNPSRPIDEEFLEAAAVVSMRRQDRGPLIERGMQVNERYNGEWVIPDVTQHIRSLTSTFIADAIDHKATRAASVDPGIFCPATGPNMEDEERAHARKRAYQYIWFRSYWNLHNRRVLRQLAAYGTATWVVIPDYTYNIPQIVARDPLHTFPEPKAIEDLSPISDCGFIYGKSAAWICQNYPEAANHVLSTPGSRPETLWDVLEWVDNEKVLIGLLGPRSDVNVSPFEVYRLRPYPLRRWANTAGRCTVHCPEMVSLNKIISAVSKVIDQADLAAKLLWLDISASEKATYPDKFIVGDEARPPRLVAGRWIDGREGEINIILNATEVGTLRDTPDPNNRMTQDRLERNVRVSSGIVPAQLGETYGSLRTGKGIDAMLAASIDPQIQEMHEINEHAMTCVNEIAADMLKGTWGRKKYTVFSGWPTDQKMLEFVPNEIFGETNANVVAYPIPGADIGMLTVAVGQLRAAELASQHTGRILHPWIKDPDAEERLILTEKFAAGMEAAIFQRMSDPTAGFAPVDWSSMMRKLNAGMSLEDAWEEVDTEARERQATVAAEAPPEGMAAPPEAMPGLGAPTEGGQQQLPPPVGPPPVGAENLRQVVRALRAPQTAVSGRR